MADKNPLSGEIKLVDRKINPNYVGPTPRAGDSEETYNAKRDE